MNFGEWLKSTRKQQGKTQQDIQDETGIVTTHLSAIENGRVALPGKPTRDRIHAVLGTSDDDLVELEILRRSYVLGTDGEARPIYFNADGSGPEYRLVREGPEVDGQLLIRIVRRLEMVDLSRVDRVATLDGILDAWERADEAERRRKA